MIPKAKKNLHQCEYHINTMRNAKDAEEFEIGYVAFVISARTVTFVLQKEFSGNKYFELWYPKKQDELKNNSLCAFFKTQRNSIEKEGVNALEFSMEICELQLPGDAIGQPQNSDIKILPKGIFYLVNKGTPKVDLLPAKIRGKISIRVFFCIDGKVSNVLEVCETYYQILKEIVEEWTGIINEISERVFQGT